jgi:hypothetical protein
MGYDYQVEAAPVELLSAIDAFDAALEAYGGETVVAHEHPLHAAAVRLEQLTRRNNHPTAKQTAKLCPPIDSCWYRLLWASRDGGRNRNPTEEDFHGPDERGAANPEYAKGWREQVRAHLGRFRSLVESGEYHKLIMCSDLTSWEMTRKLRQRIAVRAEEVSR